MPGVLHRQLPVGVGAGFGQSGGLQELRGWEATEALAARAGRKDGSCRELCRGLTEPKVMYWSACACVGAPVTGDL